VSSSSLQEIVALLGQPVAGNPTQYMMEKAFAHQGLDWRYLTLEVSPQDLGDAVRGMRSMGFRGGNCAAPHNAAILQYLDRTHPSAGHIGTVNCIVREGNDLVGENTEGKGLLESLRTRLDPAGKHIVLLGAGSVARAIAVELGLAGVAGITVVNRTAQRGEDLVKLLHEKVPAPATFVLWENDFKAPPETNVLVQATSIGQGDAAKRVAVDLETLTPEIVVADMVFNPARTRLLNDAAKRGCPTIDGLEMLVRQAAIAFKLWTDVEPDFTVLRDAVEEFLGW
jgi:shikimate dehydrogenase